jgi:hypothetical protein
MVFHKRRQIAQERGLARLDRKSVV